MITVALIADDNGLNEDIDYTLKTVHNIIMDVHEEEEDEND